MDYDKLIEDFREAIAKSLVVIIIAKCRVEYDGRINSTLELGERIIIIKSDRSIVINQPKGVMPINYMKEKSVIEFSQDDGSIIVRASSIKLKETIKIEIESVKDHLITPMTDASSIELFGTEKDMSDMIMENPAVISDDFIPLSREEHTKFGFIDVFGHDKNGTLIIVECKKVQAEYNAVMQLKRYIERVAKAKGMKAENVKGFLAAPSISDNALSYLRGNGYEFRKINPPMRNVKDKSQSSLFGYLG